VSGVAWSVDKDKALGAKCDGRLADGLANDA
jgi:hypothetical protein